LNSCQERDLLLLFILEKKWNAVEDFRTLVVYKSC
jgi:hypothetical protein